MQVHVTFSLEASGIEQARKIVSQRYHIPTANVLSFRPTKSRRDLSDFSNLGTDESGQLIGNCNKCGLHGVLVFQHICSQEHGGQQ